MHTGKLIGWCFNCEWKGNAVSFVRDYNKIPWGQALDVVNFYEEFRPLPQDIYEEVFDRMFAEDLEYEAPKKIIKPPTDFRLLSGNESYQAQRFYKYAKSRKLSDRQIELHGLGFCPEGKIIMPTKDGGEKHTFINNHLLVQTFDDNNNPIYWMARAIKSDIMPKAFNPVGDIGTLNKSDVIFNLNNAKKNGVAVLTEGVFDATTVGDSGVALFGKTLSVKQLLLLIQANLDAIYIMLDPDAKDSAVKIAELLSRHNSSVYLCMLSNGDPNEVGRKGCLEAIRDAERYTKMVALKYKLM